MLVVSSPAVPQALPVSFGEAVTLTAAFATTETKATMPRGISGIACRGTTDGTFECLAVNDEERFAEWVILKGTSLSPTGTTVQLLTRAKTITDTIVGRMPHGLCDGTDKAGEFDGEAIAMAGRYAYVTGSHACTREKHEFNPSTFVLARFDTSGEPVASAPVERTWRVSDVIRASSLAGAFGKGGDAGTAIEGTAVMGGQIYFGFRTPSIDGQAAVLSASADELFAAGDAAYSGTPGEWRIPLGANTGIRDLAPLDDHRLLVLAGPAGSHDGAYVLHVLDLAERTAAPLVELKTNQMGRKKGKDGRNGGPELAKAEAITVLDRTSEAVTLLVMYDNIDDGGPRLHRISLPK